MLIIIQYKQIVTLFLTSAIFSFCAVAQAEEAPQKIEKIEVKGLRDPGMMAYKDAYTYLQKMNASPHDKIAVRMRIVPQDKKLPLSDVKITLEGDKTKRLIPIAEDGLIEVPLDKALIDDNAEFLSNQKKDALRLHVTVEVLLPASGPLRYRYLSDALNQARDTVKNIVPWYVRWMVPNNWNAVWIDFAQGASATTTVLASSGKQVFRADKDGHMHFLLDDHLITENAELIFSAPPKKIGAGMINDLQSYTAQKPE